MRRVDTATIIAHLVFSTVHFQISESYREHTDAIITHKLKLHNSQTVGDTFCCFGGSILSFKSSRDESISVVWQDGSHQNPLHLEYWENNAFLLFSFSFSWFDIKIIFQLWMDETLSLFWLPPHSDSIIQPRLIHHYTLLIIFWSPSPIAA